MPVTLWKCIEKWQKWRGICGRPSDTTATSIQAKFIRNIRGLNPHEVDLLLSRSEFVIKTGNEHSKITIEKKVQRRGKLIKKTSGGYK